jgi:hypothetical protein
MTPTPLPTHPSIETMLIDLPMEEQHKLLMEHSDQVELAYSKMIIEKSAKRAEDQNPTKSDASNPVDLTDKTDTYDDKQEGPTPRSAKNEHGLTLINACNTNTYLKTKGSDLTVVFVKSEDKSLEGPYYNGIHLLSTVLTITNATSEVMDRLKDVKNIGCRRDLRGFDTIDFLAENNITITAISSSEGYGDIMTGNHSSPIIIEYTVLRHRLEDISLPIAWTQFCLLCKKENLLVTFNENGTNIRLGTQFNSKAWRKDIESYTSWHKAFEKYTHHILNRKIAPINRIDNKTSENLYRGLNFNRAWFISMPPPEE